MDLPGALAPWASCLTLFPRPLILALGPLVQRLDRAIGPLRLHGRVGSGDPDGFDGIARRGSYERLLISEWLLADEAPDEWARRAAMGEHAFLQLARREPAGARVSVALFDAGPSQIGAPRIAHLAALIVLARRAEAAGATFQWGVAQRQAGDPALLSGVTRAGVRLLLEARTVQEASDADLQALASRLGNSAAQRDDLWLIGGRRIGELPSGRGASLLRIEDVYEPGARELSAAILAAGQLPRAVWLPLPEDAACARLLRDPFKAAAVPLQAAPDRFTPASNLLFTATGGKLLARSRNNELLSYSLPNSPRASAGRPKIYSPRSGNPIVAAGRINKTTVVITAAPADGSLQLECVGGKCGGAAPENFPPPLRPDFAEPETASPLRPCFALPGAASSLPGVLAIIGGTLVRLQRRVDGDQRSAARLMAERCSALAPVTGGIASVGRRKDQWMAIFINEEEQSVAPYPLRVGGDSLAAFFGYGGAQEHPQFGLLATPEDSENWKVIGAYGEIFLVPPAGAEVVGVIGLEKKWRRPALVVLEADKRTISLLGREGCHSLPRASSPIEHVTVSSQAPDIAYATASGEVAVYSLAYDAFLLRLATGEAPLE